MPRTGKTKDVHLKLVLDTDELYNAFQEIKKYRGIRSNSDALRFLILDGYYRIREEIYPPELEEFLEGGQKYFSGPVSAIMIREKILSLFEENKQLKEEIARLKKESS